MKPSKQKLKRVRPILGTFVEIELHGDVSDENLNTWITEGFGAVEEIDRLMSFHRPDSDLARLNQAHPNVWVDVHPHTAKVLRASNKLYKDSRATFDIRCGAYPHPPYGHPLPTRGRMRVPLVFCGTRVCKTGPWTLDLGGIAKGYAVDCAVNVMKHLSRGRLIAGVVNAGGDLRRWGPGAPPVAVATSCVRSATQQALASRVASPMSEATAALTEAIHVHMPSGKVLEDEKAVSVLSARCLWSDALTKVMLLAPQKVAQRCLRKYRAQGLVLA